MTQNVKISGMTCKGCVSSVTDKLISLDEVKDVKIDLTQIYISNVKNVGGFKNIDIGKIDDCVAPKVHTFVGDEPG